MNPHAILLCLLLSCPALADEKVVFQCDFDGEDEPAASSDEGRLVVGYRGSQSLLIERTDRGSYSRRFAIAGERLGDRVATLRAMVKAENVSEPPQSWNGIKVMLDLHTPPGGRTNGGVCRMFQEKRYQDKLIEVWDRIARRYKGREVVYAYDLLNEAVAGLTAS